MSDDEDVKLKNFHDMDLDDRILKVCFDITYEHNCLCLVLICS